MDQRHLPSKTRNYAVRERPLIALKPERVCCYNEPYDSAIRLLFLRSSFVILAFDVDAYEVSEWYIVSLRLSSSLVRGIS